VPPRSGQVSNHSRKRLPFNTPRASPREFRYKWHKKHLVDHEDDNFLSTITTIRASHSTRRNLYLLPGLARVIDRWYDNKECDESQKNRPQFFDLFVTCAVGAGCWPHQGFFAHAGACPAIMPDSPPAGRKTVQIRLILRRSRKIKRKIVPSLLPQARKAFAA
jgi:hypothetical protein